MLIFLRILTVFLCLFAFAPASGQVKDRIQLNSLNTTTDLQEIKDAEKLRLTYPDSARRLLLQLLRNNRIKLNVKGTRRCLVALSYFYTDARTLEQTLQFAKRGIQLCDSTAHRKELANLYNNIGEICYRQSRYKESFDARLQALNYAKEDPLLSARIENNLSEVILLFGSTNLALEYMERSLKTAVSYKDTTLWVLTLLNISRIKERHSTGNFRYMDSCLALANKLKQYSSLYIGTINKGSILANNGKPLEGLRLVQAADTLSRYWSIPAAVRAKADEIAGTAYTGLGQYRLAEQQFLKGLAGTDNHSWLSNMNHLTNLYIKQGDFKKAFYTARELQKRIDSVGRRDMQLKVIATEIQYRTAEKDKQLAEKNLLLAKKENELKIRNTWIAVMAIGGALLVGMVLLLRRNYRQKQKIQLAEQMNLQLKARVEGEEQERKRISQELHDGIGGILSAAKMNLSGVEPAVPSQAPKYERGVQLLDDAYKELRQTAHNLSPHILKSKGLVATLIAYCKKTSEAQNMDIRLQHLGEPEHLKEGTALATYRIIQELIQNIVKHSGATTAMVQLSYREDYLDITVEDNGKGMKSNNQNEGIGLRNIKDRVAALNGSIEIDSRPGEGTTIYINMSIK